MTENISNAGLFARSQKVVPGGVHSPVRAFSGVGGRPFFVKHASGVTLEDVEERLYTDYCLSWGPLIFGHQDCAVQEAVQAALYRGWSFGTAEPYSLALAEMITEHLAWVEKIRFVNSGTEAVMSALRIARAATGRAKILKFSGCYHGHADSLLVKAGSGLADMARPDSAGVSAAVAAETLVAPLNDPETLEKIWTVHGTEIAGVIVEPLPANYGLLPQTTEFLGQLAKRARDVGALLIFDEVITGFRVAFGGMAECTGIRPDLVTYGKIIGGGFPVGAYGGSSDLMDYVAPAGPVYQAGTLSANPVCMAAGLAMLKKLQANPPYHHLAAQTQALAAAITEKAQQRGFPCTIQHAASLFWPVFGQAENCLIRNPEAIPAQHKTLYTAFFHQCLQKTPRGIYLPPSAFEVAFLSTAHEDHQPLIEAFDQFFQNIAKPA